MLPVISLVGRPNVGKSTLFNRLTRSRDALVDDQPGVTRDRLYGKGRLGDRSFLVVDTGGMDPSGNDLADLIQEQVDQVISESDVILFIVNAEEGLVLQDIDIANKLRKSGRRIVLLVNKAEGRQRQLVSSDFQELALDQPRAISAKRGDGVVSAILPILEELETGISNEYPNTPKIAIVGRPNVGKSTLANKLSGKERVIVSDLPGTTRDSVEIPIQSNGVLYTIVDTAGVRKKSKIEDTIEKFSVVKTLTAIEQCNVALLVLDAESGIQAQDVAIAGMVLDLGKSIVIVVNKWDRLPERKRTRVKKDLQARMGFLPDPKILYVSARHGSNLASVLPAVDRTLASAMIEISTSSINRVLEDALVQTPPPMHDKRPVRLKFAHQAGKNPPLVVIHGNLTNTLPESYRRYLARYFARAYSLVGTPVRIVTRVGKNPYGSKVNRNPRVRSRSGRRSKL